MKEAFVAADPARLAGGDVTARQILESSRQTIAPLALSQPENYLSLAVNIADVQLSLGMVDSASVLLAEAEAVAERSLPAGPQRADLHLLAVRAALEANEVTVAQHIVDADLDPARIPAATYWYLKGMIPLKRLQFPAAIAAFERAIAARPDAVRNGDWVQAHLMLADALAEQKRADQGLVVLDRLLVELRHEYGAEHSQVARAELARLDVLQLTGQSERMRAEGQALAEEITRRYGRASALTGRAEVAVAAAFIGNADYAQAAEHTRRAAESFEQSLGPGHSRSYRARFNLGSLLWRVSGRAADAEQAFETALSNAEQDLEPNDPTLAFFRLEFAKFLVWSRQPQRALQTYAGNLERLRAEPLGASDKQEAVQMLIDAHDRADCAKPAVRPGSTLTSICADRPLAAGHCVAARDLACALSQAALSGQ